MINFSTLFQKVKPLKSLPTIKKAETQNKNITSKH